MASEPTPHLSPDQFRALAHRMVDYIADYMARVETFPVLSPSRPGDILAKLPDRPPETGLGDLVDPVAGWSEIFDDLDSIILPGLTHWQSPGFFGYFPCNSSGPGILGELLSAGLNVNGMLWATSPAATELETRCLDWMAQLIGLPAPFHSTGNGGGCIQSTASDSTLVAMLAARQRALAIHPDKPPELVAYASTQAHSSVIKAAMIAGVAQGPDDRTHVRLIDTDETFAMRPDLLDRAILEDRANKRTPFFVCATVGTTSSTAIDPIAAIAPVLEEDRVVTGARRRAWLHVDAAHCGCACVCPEFRWMLRGVEEVDSLCFNPHKWLLTNFDCDCFYIADRGALTDALSITPEYLRNAATASGQVIDYRDWQVPLGRRFRALKLWFVLRHYGARGLQAHIRGHVALAELFQSLVAGDARFELAAPRTVNLVCFRLKAANESTEAALEADAATRAIQEGVNGSGKAFLTHTTLPDRAGRPRYTLRLAIGSPGTEERHVQAVWEQIREIG